MEAKKEEWDILSFRPVMGAMLWAVGCGCVATAVDQTLPSLRRIQRATCNGIKLMGQAKRSR